MITVQLVSKPVAPPWNDATKVLVHAILANRASCNYRFFGTPGSGCLEGPHVTCDVVSRVDRFQPTTADHVRTLLQLARPASDVGVYHCLFTPNPRTSSALRLVFRIKRRPVVHTLCSSPDDWRPVVPLLFADHIVTVSRWAQQQLESLDLRNVSHIPPGIVMPSPTASAIAALRRAHDLPEGRPCLVFSGDYEYSAAHPVIVGALPQIVRRWPEAIVVFACRTKTPHAVAVEAAVRNEIESAGLLRHVRFLRQIDDFESLLALATIVLFPVQSLRRKMDVPLTLLQALALRRPIIASTLGPLTELTSQPVGIGIPIGDPAALAEAVDKLLGDAAMREAFGIAGEALVKQRYLSEHMAHAYEALYSSLAA